MERIDAVVVGAGAVGLAVARELALRGRETIVLEAGPGIGNGTSSRNSEVIHAGLYDAPGSLKATLCVSGREALYPYCESRGVGHRRCGKLVVAATPAQVETLKAIEARATTNGVRGLRWLSGAEARQLEPASRGEAALLSTVTGIIDSHALMLAFQGDLENAGGAVVLRAPVESAAASDGGFVLRVGGAAPDELNAGILVNAAGLHAPALARSIAGLDAGRGAASLVRQGQLLRPRPPIAVQPSDLSGARARRSRRSPHARPRRPGTLRSRCRVARRRIARRDRLRRRPFARRAVLRRGPPLLARSRGRHPGAGVQRRATEAAGAGAPPSDFMLQGPEAHGVAGLVNLYGIESPGLTASLAIAAEVARRLDV